MLGLYKGFYDLAKMLLGISLGLAIGWVFIAVLKLLFEVINLDELL